MATGHLKYNEKPEAELLQVMGQHDTPTIKARPVTVNTSCDVPYLGGMSVSGKTVYIDREFYEDLKSGRLDIRGMTPRQILQAIIEHEHTEKSIMDGDNPVDTYPAAHEYATTAEHDFVRKLGVNPEYYEKCLDPFIDECLRKPPQNPPRDLWCGPILDDPNAEDKRILRQLRAKGVEDANKKAKEDVRYGMGAERCEDCAMFQKPNSILSQCDVVSGLVRYNRHCDEWIKRK